MLAVKLKLALDVGVPVRLIDELWVPDMVLLCVGLSVLETLNDDVILGV